MAEHCLVDPGVSYLQNRFSGGLLATTVRQASGSPIVKAVVLVVDAEPGVRQLLRNVLTGAGYDVLEAANVFEAAGQLRRSIVDLVLLDSALPNVQGLDTIKVLRKERPGIRVIAMAGRLPEELVNSLKNVHDDKED